MTERYYRNACGAPDDPNIYLKAVFYANTVNEKNKELKGCRYSESSNVQMTIKVGTRDAQNQHTKRHIIIHHLHMDEHLCNMQNSFKGFIA